MRLRIYARRLAPLALLVSLFGIGTGISAPPMSAEGREAPLVAATKASDTAAVQALDLEIRFCHSSPLGSQR